MDNLPMRMLLDIEVDIEDREVVVDLRKLANSLENRGYMALMMVGKVIPATENCEAQTHMFMAWNDMFTIEEMQMFTTMLNNYVAQRTLDIMESPKDDGGNCL